MVDETLSKILPLDLDLPKRPPTPFISSLPVF